MNLKKLLNPKGTNLWLLISNVGWNMVWAIGALIIAYVSLRNIKNATTMTQLVLLVSAFVGPFLGGWLCGWSAADGRGPTYGVIGSLSNTVIFLIALVPVGGILGVLVAVAALVGGLNGGLVSLRRSSRG